MGPSLAAIVFYGSHLNRTAGAGSDHDFFVMVDGYARAHRRRVHGWVNALLPPSIYRRRVRVGGDDLACKLSILSLDDLARATSPAARDSYVMGRLGKRVAIAWARDEAARRAVEDAACRATALCGAWALRGIQGPFSLDAFVLEALSFSYRCEERVEGSDRAKVIFAADEAYFRAAYGAWLGAAELSGLVRKLERDGPLRASGLRRQRHAERQAYARFVRASRRRARMRWLKNVWTFEGWVDYMLAKIERHQGIAIALTPRERRFPLLAAARGYLRLRREGRLH
jgi:hypothetical protein